MRILLATHVCPFPATSGGELRTRRLLEALEELGDVDLLVMKNDYNRGVVEAGEETGRAIRAVVEEPSLPAVPGGEAGRRLAYHRDAGRRLLHPSPETVAALQRQLEPGSYDLVVGRYMRTVTCCGLLPGPVPVALDVDDYHPALLRARLSHTDPLTRLTLRRQLRFAEKRWPQLLDQASHLWVSNPEDRGFAPLASATFLPNLPFGAPAEGTPQLPLPSPDHFGLIGTWSYSANAHGLRWLLNKAWPRLRRLRPSARLFIAGEAPARLRRLASGEEGVTWLGRIGKPAELYARTAVFLAPLLFGAGTNIKVLEGAAFGRPGVVTPVALRGFGETLGRSGALRVAADPESFAEAMRAWAEDPAAAGEAGRRGKDCVERSYRPENFPAAVREGVWRALA